MLPTVSHLCTNQSWPVLPASNSEIRPLQGVGRLPSSTVEHRWGGPSGRGGCRDDRKWRGVSAHEGVGTVARDAALPLMGRQWRWQSELAGPGAVPWSFSFSKADAMPVQGVVVALRCESLFSNAPTKQRGNAQLKLSASCLCVAWYVRYLAAVWSGLPRNTRQERGGMLLQPADAALTAAINQ